MMKNIKSLLQFCIVLFLLLSFAKDGQAQNWERVYGTSNKEIAHSAIEVSDGDFIVLCATDTLNVQNFNPSFFFLLRVDSYGTVISRDTLDGCFVNEMKLLDNGDFMLNGREWDSTFERPFLKRYDSNATELWTQFYRDTFDVGYDTIGLARVHDFTELQNGEILFHASYTNSGPIADHEILSKVTANGDLIWERELETNPFYEEWHLETLSDGNVIILGEITSSHIKKIDTEANILWDGFFGDFLAQEVVVDDNGGLMFSEFLDGESFHLDATGNIIETLPGGILNSVSGIFVDAIAGLEDGSIIQTGRTYNGSPDDTGGDNIYLRKTFLPPGEEWVAKTYTRPFKQQANAVSPTSDGGFLISGWTRDGGNGRNIYLIKVDEGGEFDNHTVSGNVSYDLNLNCVGDTLEPALAGFYIIAEGTDTTYTVSDSSGNYSLGLELGTYTIRIVSPNDYWSICSESVSVDLIELHGTTTVDFLTQAESVCPYLEVDITAPILRRCFDNTYYVSYCNSGTEDATDVSIEVTLDDFMEVAWTSIPYTSNTGNLYVFDIGDVGLGECNDFQIYFELDPDCDSTDLGETHCVEAHVYPDSFCMVDPSWTGANVALSSDCAPDSLSFFIENNGTGNMAGPLAYIIIEDEVILLQGVFELDINEIKTLKVPSNGSTYRLEAEQEPNHPANDEVSLTVEGCGANANGDVSYGFVNLYPDNDGNPFVEMDCQENIGAFDPNDKQGFPIGYDEEHYIDQNEEIEYMIRFQNTGTDTAFNVVVLDSLSRYLNPVSVRPGASSHPYDFSIRDNGVLVFTFENIMLPDSNINEPASHGFFKFRIDQLLDVPLGSEILNSGAIYFDFNDPVITNTTLHTVGENYMIVNSQEVFVPNLEVLVYPNPFKEEVTFELKGERFQDAELYLFDGLGSLIQTTPFENDQLVLNKKVFSPGVYFYTIQYKGGMLSSGKIIMQE